MIFVCGKYYKEKCGINEEEKECKSQQKTTNNWNQISKESVGYTKRYRQRRRQWHWHIQWKIQNEMNLCFYLNAFLRIHSSFYGNLEIWNDDAKMLRKKDCSPLGLPMMIKQQPFNSLYYCYYLVGIQFYLWILSQRKETREKRNHTLKIEKCDRISFSCRLSIICDCYWKMAPNKDTMHLFFVRFSKWCQNL